MKSTKIKKSNSGKKGVNALTVNPVYGQPTPGFRPKCVYVYYLRETGVPKDRVRAYFVERSANITNMGSEALTILNDIAANRIMPCGWGLGDIRWRRRSYILVLFEDQHHKLEQDNAVTFRPYHTFKGGADILSFAGHPRITGFYCENHLTVAGGGDVDYRGEGFFMEVNHDGHDNLRIASHNDTSTNMGPPIPPP